MVDPEEMQDRHAAQLAELAALGMSLARDLSARAGAVASLEEAEGLALAFHRIARTVRLTLALESRLAREQGEVRRLSRIHVREINEARSGQVRHALARDIWNETDGEDAEALMEELDEALAEDVLFGRLLSAPVETTIARLRADLGLPKTDLADGGDNPLPDPPAANDRAAADPASAFSARAEPRAPPPLPSG
ncbi:hypothetical protein [Phenylobacterium sp.]|uniref:hypothetical protein n=1 Tax=Phenylobacterium sp. TaxID=1871053 RepID=UPI0035AFDDB2